MSEHGAWVPPARPPTDAARLPAMNGSRLFEQGRYKEEADAVRRFLEGPRPVTFEVGFDHGMCLADRARALPDTLQLGVEIREARVLALAPHLPPNALGWRADARAALASVVPAGRLAAIVVYFPDPIWVEGHRERRLLFSPAFLTLCARALAPGGVLHLATDVEPYFRYVETLLDGWEPCAPPPLGTALSRRERVCRRDGLPVFRGSYTPRSSDRA